MGLLKEIPEAPRSKKGWPWDKESHAIPERMANGDAWPRISIVTPSYNQGKYIEETIRSVLLQNYPNLEYCIIDGGSSDNSLEIIQKYDPWLTYWISEPDRGQSHAINKGFCRCSGDIYNWLCSDDILLINSLLYVAKNMNIDNPFWLIGRAQTIDDSTGEICLRNIDSNLDFTNFIFWLSMSLPQPSIFWNKPLQNAVGALNENLNYCMDVDHWYRFQKIVMPTFSSYEISRYRFHKDAKTTAYNPEYQSFLLELSDWLLDFIICEAQGGGRTEVVHSLMELQRKASAWHRVSQHVVFRQLLFWWKKIINPRFPVV